MTFDQLLAREVVRQFHDAKEAQKWEADYVLRAQVQAEADYVAYQRFLREHGFVK